MSDALEPIRRVMRSGGLARVADSLLVGLRPGVHYKLAGGEGAIGVTRFGGSPDVPPGFEWPTHDGVDARFVAQLDLAELSALMPDNPLPRDGLLSFFWWQEDPHGCDPDGCRVHLFARQGLCPHPDPWSLKAKKVGLIGRLLGSKPSPLGQGWQGCTATPRFTWWLNHLTLESGLFGQLTDKECDLLFGGLESELAQAGLPGEGHHALGCAQPIQSAVEVEAEVDPCSTGKAAWEAAAARAGDWRCLLEVVSDDAPGFCFGDWGNLYFMMKEADLKQGRFNQVRIVTQCG